MFYSQFILAKKGPLGTIWIAAHLERKLRKNQVADTDIGESVDSILFPDVPIALRLSSHLLLGVVRIYSKKVNYLFHDCSEALLKIKQAFRSTAVDLPPEESTAPYHSITLPETFDLDDFELPESALLSGSFVDHHVSTREQITLQDSVDATAYSTSLFGLEERFGDGDASQIRLDLDEDMILEKGSMAHHISDLLSSEDVEHRVSGQPETPFPDMDIDGCQHDYDEAQDAETAKEVPERISDDLGTPIVQNAPDLREDISADGCNSHITYLHKGVTHGEHLRSPAAVSVDAINQMPLESTENAQAPRTPGLMQEAIPASVQENPALSPSGKTSPSNDTEIIVVNATQNSHIESDSKVQNENELSNTTSKVFSPGSILEQSEIATSVSQPSVPSLTTPDRTDPPCEDSAGVVDACQDNALLASASVASLRPCNTNVNQDNLTSLQDVPNKLSVSDGMDQLHPGESSSKLHDGDTNQKLGQTHMLDEADLSKDAVSSNEIPKDIRLEDNLSAINEYPEPERMRFATGLDTHAVDDLGQCTLDLVQCTTAEKGVAESDESVDRVKSSRGRKRRLPEGTPAMLNGNSAKSSRASLLGKSTDYIPADDDVLASILVGRNPSLKMKPTPTLPSMPPSKRTRLLGKSSVPKRKVLMDDTMVLHADAIRQQLVNTEDIRRTRRKAPCTNSEIWMIQKCSLEEEIFDEPLLTGATLELTVLHSQAYDPNKTFDSNCSDTEVTNVQNFGSSGFIEEVKVKEIGAIPGKTDGEKTESTDVDWSVQTIPHPLDCSIVDQGDSYACQFEASISDHQGLDVQPETDKHDDSREMNSGLPLPENQQSLLESSHVIDEVEIKVSQDTTLTDAEEGSDAGNISLSYRRDPDLDACKAVNDVLGIPAGEQVSTCIPTMEHNREGNMASGAGDQVVGESDNQQPTSEHALVDVAQVTVSDLPSINAALLDNPSSVGEDTSLKDVTDMDTSHFDTSVPRDYNVQDFCSAIGGDDTDFLNMDDEADFDEVDNEVSHPEEAQSIENSGWSTRTRDVARYLKSLFDDESGLRKTTVPMDHLLAGKTRKQASRMFFEALVLKTKDFIHVEQENSFRNINIKPRSKLLKSEF